ncbi:hypothetical protein [Chitinophaga pinensis]|uniref:Uncharacterized protein n=1 Tax=Chitinophaga pinensis (strain ATCC 43595 / DSM 2588 / LMG 13176 / NBRC 15968 / NCIMB 11800 / UQM 2034) TaxID=485918 RepID=A0A979G9M0_CHIPD|nr:hypothetical protein [Chitinophaga pinensis]ACU63197.1 hypothetical protein Cpin_5777 [Chitinophaga pinensis DSM 2588]
MVEVFKTTVNSRTNALLLLEQIHNTYSSYRANFDLEDCDRILRVECISGKVDELWLIRLLQKAGFDAAVLEDEIC